MKFKECMQYFQNLEQEPSRTAMTKILAELLNQACARDAKIIAYFSMGSLFAAYQDIQFNIAQKNMIAILAEFLNVAESTIQGHARTKGDLGLVIFEMWQGEDQGLTLHEIYELLVDVAKISGTGSSEKKAKAIIKILRQVDAVSAKFIVRIVTKTMRLGFSDMTFLDALSWMLSGSKKLTPQIEHAYNICADLGLVAYTLKNGGISAIANMDIHVGIPILPAAAERLKSPQAIIDKLGDCVAQPKLDGFRVQVHLKRSGTKTDVHFFSRNMLDMSDMFPDLKQAISHLPVKSLICEGEAIGYDEATDTFLPFQETVKRKRKHDIEQVSQQLPLRLYLFDLLYLDGESFLDKAHKQRRKELVELCKLFKDVEIKAIEEKHIYTAQQLQEYFLTCIAVGLEGLVVKREDAVYQPGKRNFNWIKLKRESQGELIDTVDGVILGYYVGRGKRAHFGIGAFLLGVYDEDTDQFKTVAKVGTGLTDAGWKDLKKRCELLIVKQQPKNVMCAKELFVDVWIKPEIVCEILSEEITLSPMHTAGRTEAHLGYGLRFPRFVKYRDDKSAQQATTVKELKELYRNQKK
ncbi:ATP-dependent DNA ligase [Candidatus Dependentiae bacterium]|nr:ATP-dependent DNA ligase [Candidatus Dependentiae bacterium]